MIMKELYALGMGSYKRRCILYARGVQQNLLQGKHTGASNLLHTNKRCNILFRRVYNNILNQSFNYLLYIRFNKNSVSHIR